MGVLQKTQGLGIVALALVNASDPQPGAFVVAFDCQGLIEVGQGVVIAFQVQGHGPHLEVLLVFPIRPLCRGRLVNDQPRNAFHGVEGLLG